MTEDRAAKDCDLAENRDLAMKPGPVPTRFDRLMAALNSVTTHGLTIDGRHTLTVVLSPLAAEDVIRKLTDVVPEDRTQGHIRSGMSHAERWRAEQATLAAIPEAGPCGLCGAPLGAPAEERPAPDHYSGPTLAALTPGEHKRHHNA